MKLQKGGGKNESDGGLDDLMAELGGETTAVTKLKTATFGGGSGGGEKSPAKKTAEERRAEMQKRKEERAAKRNAAKGSVEGMKLPSSAGGSANMNTEWEW